MALPSHLATARFVAEENVELVRTAVSF